jgi:signal transduction histidine kinase
MNNLLSQLKANAAPRPTPLASPEAIVAAVAGEFASGSVVVETSGDDRDTAVAIAPERLRSALAHLVQNALDASPPDGPVIISTRRLGSQFTIAVVDRGAGMNETFIRDELFLPFRSTKTGGYGIGAFQTRELIRMAGGDIEVISEPGAGTTMRIVLPVVLDRETATPSDAA